MEITGISATPVHIQANNEVNPQLTTVAQEQQSPPPQVKNEAPVGQYIDVTA